MSPFEKACRALCELEGNPPGATFEGKPMWLDYADQVKVVLVALEDVSQMQIAAATAKADQIGSKDFVGIWRAMLDAVQE